MRASAGGIDEDLMVVGVVSERIEDATEVAEADGRRRGLRSSVVGVPALDPVHGLLPSWTLRPLGDPRELSAFSRN
jgi:hypothetical protein